VTGLLSEIRVEAYAKINLSLDVLGRRADGYHDLRSILQTVSLSDTITFRTGRNTPEPVSNNSDYSLIDQAIASVRAVVPEAPAVGYEIEKRIPVAAGLGGGSADCAAAILSTAKLLGVTLIRDRLLETAAGLGSDIPFFVDAGTALVEGRGERVTPLADAPLRWFLLVNGGGSVSTAEVFQALAVPDHGTGTSTDRARAALAQSQMDFGGNDLTAAALRVSPEIGEVFDLLATVTDANRIALSGSGGTVAAIFDREEEAVQAYEQIRGRAPFIHVANSVTRAEVLSQWA
jgi:4-diphosphocytidyl-2-C-methyl-D-erythritol kinase